MLASLNEFKFFQQFRLPIEEADDIRFLVEMTDENGKTVYVEGARLVDISVTGLGFATTQRLSVGEELEISLQFRKQHLDISGKVVRSFSTGLKEEDLIYGVALDDDRDLQKFLEYFIQSFSIERLRDCLIQSAVAERYTSPHEGFEMFSLLLSLIHDMTKLGDQKQFIDSMLQEVCRILNAKRASLFLINPDTNELEAVSALGIEHEILKFDYRKGIAGQVFTTGVALNIDTENDRCRFDSFFDKKTGFHTKSIICNPIYNREDKIIGVIEVLNKRNENRFSVEDEKVMKVVGLVFSSLYHNYNPLSETSIIRRFSTPFDREYALVGNSPFITGLRSVVIKLKDVDAPVLIEGEPGTGKTLFSKILHYEGKWGLGPFEIIPCSGVDQNQVRKDLFGNGPESSKLEAAKGGSVVISHIDHLSLADQQKLYDILISGMIPEGRVQLDVKIMATTTAHIPKLVEEGKFNAALFELLSKGMVEMQPLRKHPEDIPELLNYFIRLECKRQGLLVKNFAPAVLKKLTDYDWPGNTAELKHSIERLVLYNPKNHVISNLENFPTPVFDQYKTSGSLYDIPHANDPNLLLKDRISLIERELIYSSIKKCHGNKSKAAKTMGISREALRKKLIQSDEILQRLESEGTQSDNVSHLPERTNTDIDKAA